MERGKLRDRLDARARELKRDLYALYLAYRKPQMPWYLKVLTAAVVGYALSPIDLIPDFIPVLGQLDDLIIVPAGIALILRLMPPGLMDSCRAEAMREMSTGKPRAGRIAAVIVVAVWLLVLGLIAKAVLLPSGK